MNNAAQLPDLGNAFAKLKLQQLIGANTDPSLFACICRDQVYSKPKEVFQMVKEQVRDNEPLCRSMLGDDVINLAKRIL